jgi:iron complex transport system permease protein
MKNIALFFSIIILVIAPFIGQIDLNLQDILQSSTPANMVFWEIRVPRVLLAFFVGGILALGGLVFQIVFRNPMGTPFTLGVASGATLFTAIAIVLGFSLFIPLFAFIGAVLTIVILFGVASRFKTTGTTSLLLVGIALSFFYSAALMVVFFISNLQESYEIVRFTMGSLDIVGLHDAIVVSITAVILIILILQYKYQITLLLTSHDFARLKGIDIKKTNYILLLVTSLAVGVAVSITGPIGFIGLVVPHIIRLIYKQSYEKLILPIFFYGGVFLVFCDIIARNLGTVSDIPIGVVTSFIGAPFFIYLIVKRRQA